MRVALALFAVGWGANQFVPMLLLYRQEGPLSDGVADSLFAAYALALIPALFLGGYLSDKYGRAVVKPGLVASIAASAVLMSSDVLGTPALTVGRVLAGIASGLVFAPGTAWVKELSGAKTPSGAGHTGARRAALAMTAGFALGPVCTGLLVQVGPWTRVLPYVPHLLLAACSLLLIRNVPDTQDGMERTVKDGAPHSSARKPRTSSWVPLFFVAPWVFAAPSLVSVVVPTVLRPTLGGNEYLYSGLLIGATMMIGVSIQPWAGRLEGRRPGLTDVVGLAFVATGLLSTLASIASSSIALSLLSAGAFGLGYSVCLVGGLTAMQRSAPPERLGTYTALFYAAAYTGFGLPLALTSLQHVGLGLQLCLTGLTGAVGLTAVLLERTRRRGSRLQPRGLHAL